MKKTGRLRELPLSLLLSILLVSCAGAAPVTPPAALAPPPTVTVLPSPTSQPAVLSIATPTVIPVGSVPAAPIQFASMWTGDPKPFGAPVGIAMDPQGNMYVVDMGNSTVQNLDRNGKTISEWKIQDIGGSPAT